MPHSGGLVAMRDSRRDERRGASDECPPMKSGFLTARSSAWNVAMNSASGSFF